MVLGKKFKSYILVKIEKDVLKNDIKRRIKVTSYNIRFS